jgi:hypothetical protein
MPKSLTIGSRTDCDLAASELLTVPTTAVPEPSTMGPAAVAGLAGLGCLWRRRRAA